MLDKETLKNQIKQMFDDTLADAMERAFLQMLPERTAAGDAAARKFGETINNLLAPQWSDTLASAIDYYVKNIELHGQVITTGGPTTQFAMINCTPTPTVNGSIPNTLGIR